MAQVGSVRNLSMVESGWIVTGGIEKAETISRSESLVFGVAKLSSETISKVETVIITNT